MEWLCHSINFNLMKIIVFLLLLVNQSNTIYSQSDTVKSLIKRFNFNSFIYGINLKFVEPLKFKHQYDELINSKYLLSGSFEIGINKDLSKKFRLNTSIGAGLLPFNFNYVFQPEENSLFNNSSNKYNYNELDLNNSEYYYFNSYLIGSINIERKIYEKKETDFYASLGFNYYYFPFDYSYELLDEYAINDNQSYTTFKAYNIDSLNNQHILGLKISIFGNKVISKRSSLKYGLSYSYSPFSQINGEYSFYNFDFINNGTFKQSINSINIIFALEILKNKK